jgi:phage tail sheath protein FI
VAAGERLVLPIGYGETDALGFGALYHGWAVIREESGALRAIAPDGPVTGLLARRANERGAWVAPANEPLVGPVALDHPASPSRWQDLQQLRVNLLRHEPRGFTVMAADTLAPDDDLRPIGVRRLLILLRRLALRLGSTYVFEPNDDVLRRMVQRGFESMLGTLFQRGAFAGGTASTAYQVVTGESLNTPASVERGRLLVEIRVAPSRPMAFLTLRLVQVGDRLAAQGA